MLRFLAGAGLRPLLLDWGWPGEVERGFTLTDYMAGRLERALVAVGAPVVLAGYCMGGLLAMAAAQRRPEQVRALALLATPWDFHAADRAGAERLRPRRRGVRAAAGGRPERCRWTRCRRCSRCSSRTAIAAKYRAFAPALAARRAGAALRGAGGLAERRHPARRPGRARDAGAAGTAPTRRRAANGASPACRCEPEALRAARLRRHSRPRPHRAAGERAPARRA